MASSIQKFDFEHMTTAIADQVKAKLATKQDTLQLDASPTQNSAKFVNSGAVYTAIKDAEPFTGTTAEWKALTATEKARYVIVNLIDDTSGGGDESNIKNLVPSATKELTTTATKAHSEGDYFNLNGKFVKAIDDITIGDTLTEGINIETTNVGDELVALRSGDPEEQFKRYYNLDNKATTIGSGTITEVSSVATAVTTFAEVVGGKDIVTVITPIEGKYKYTKTTQIRELSGGGKTITESYTKELKEA